MPWPLLVASYFILWWLVFFAVLPFGIRTHYDENRTEPGIADSSLIAPRLAIKFLAATVISAVIFAALHALLTSGAYTLDDIPYFPRFDRTN